MTTKPVRVLQFVDNFDIGGTQKHCVQLANALAANPDFEVHVGCLKLRGELLQNLQVGSERVEAYPLSRFYDGRGLIQIFRLAHRISKRGYDIVHAHDFYANVICTAASTLSASRLIVGRRYWQLSERRIHEFAERWSYRFADAIVLNSRTVADRLIDQGVLAASKMAVIPNGIELEQFDASRVRDRQERSRSNGSGPRIGVVGSLCPDKDHETLILATSRLRARWPDLELVLVGDGSLRAKLEALVESHHLQDHVRFVGAQRDVHPWLSSFDLAVLSSRREGMPNALLEYLAMGLPVVATCVGAIPEVVQHGAEGLLVPPGDAKRLASAIDAVLTNDRRRLAMAEAGRRKAEQYQLRDMVAGYVKLYQQLLKQGERVTPSRRALRAIREELRVRSVR